MEPGRARPKPPRGTRTSPPRVHATPPVVKCRELAVGARQLKPNTRGRRAQWAYGGRRNFSLQFLVVPPPHPSLLGFWRFTLFRTIRWQERVSLFLRPHRAFHPLTSVGFTKGSFSANGERNPFPPPPSPPPPREESDCVSLPPLPPQNTSHLNQNAHSAPGPPFRPE